jgi:hypothetical protein
MSFSADKVNVLKGAFSQRRFSSSKDPSESGESWQLLSFSLWRGVRYVISCIFEACESFNNWKFDEEFFFILYLAREVLRHWVSEPNVLLACARPSSNDHVPSI